MRESDIREYLVKCVKEVRGEIRKVKWIGRRGAPDELVLLDAFSSFVELKAPGEKPDVHQLREHNLLRRAGLYVKVIDSFVQAERLVFEKRHD